MADERFQKAEREFFFLKGQFAAGRITREQFDAEREKLALEDARGQHWKLDAETGKWLAQKGDTWVEADPYAEPTTVTTTPEPKTVSTVTAAKATNRNSVVLPLLLFGCAALLCLALFGGALLASFFGMVKVNVNLFQPSTPTFIALHGTTTPPVILSTPTLAEFVTPIGGDEPTSAPSSFPTATLVPATPTTAATPSLASPLVFDANFAASCPLFEGDNETREYKCANGEYVMLHKLNTTRYTYLDNQYDDGIYEAEGNFVSGTGQYEYGIVFRADVDGKLYYVFTVNRDGKYNVAVYKDNKYTDLIPYTASPLVKTGSESNSFKVIAQGDQLAFYLNDQWIGTVNDSSIAAGRMGLFLYNAEPDVQVSFDRMRVSKLDGPVDVPTGVATGVATDLTATPTTASAAITPNVAPGVYVNTLTLSPGAPKRGQPVTFTATFVNTTGNVQSYNWFVEIWQENPDKRFGQADGNRSGIPQGTNGLTAGGWKLSGGGPCQSFRARVVYQNDESQRIPFLRTNGAELWLPFQVCP